MKNEFLSKLLKVSVITAILLVGVSALYYFVVFLPQQRTQNKERDFLFSMKQECQKAGDKLYQADVKSLGVNSLFVPEYAYNKSLNTCLYFGGFTKDDSTGGSSNYWVKDIFANKEILHFYILATKDNKDPYILKCENCATSLEEFKKRKGELFNE